MTAEMKRSFILLLRYLVFDVVSLLCKIYGNMGGSGEPLKQDRAAA
jgi:hypothetical protein